MDAHVYPGKGLSLSQLVFALNEELRRVAYSPCFTPDEISQLDQDASTALAAIREWKNSFVPINRIPLDIFSLIPTYLSSQKDRFRASFVCRHWRRAFLQQGAIWTELFTRKGEAYITTLLGRTKGSGLDVIVNGNALASIVTLLPPRQIKNLSFTNSCWENVVEFSEATSGPFPLLRTLSIDTYSRFGGLNTVDPPSLPFFGGAVNLDRFVLHSNELASLNHFVFPNLTTFGLLTSSVEGFGASNFLSFLEASPALRTVEVTVAGEIELENISQETIIILPNVETFSLRVRNGMVTQAHDIVAHISCPCAKHTSLIQEMQDYDVTHNLETFPVPASWSSIVHQHAKSPAEEVVLEVEFPEDAAFMICSLTFQSLDGTVIRLGSEVLDSGPGGGGMPTHLEEMGFKAFSRAHTVIRWHPLPSHIKRLRFKYNTIIEGFNLVRRMTIEVRKLFHTIGPLDELTIHDCDLRIFLGPILNLPEFNHWEQQTTLLPFPPIKELTISHPLMDYGEEEEHMNAIVELARTQHAFGIPFERLTIRAEKISEGLEERLKTWVGVANCYKERYVEGLVR